ncbi:hypothetical protein EZS27_024738 [termite gut metagenome]|uniref:Uncharacterized protein n=1 Tax=termite gut metagenome TaxID=433724 RepID=A0A5J4QYD9_9ZZZZ
MHGLTTQISELQHQTDELLCLGVDGSPVYTDVFSRLNTEVLQHSEALFPLKGETPEEEARLCSALLAGYHATIYNHGDKEEKIQFLLNRAWKVLDVLPASAVKCELLIYCYEEVFEDELLKEAKEMIDGWSGRKLSEEEQKVIEIYREAEES